MSRAGHVFLLEGRPGLRSELNLPLRGAAVAQAYLSAGSGNTWVPDPLS